MADQRPPEPEPTLASLRRRGGSRPRPTFGQTDLFSESLTGPEHLFTAAEVQPLQLSEHPATPWSPASLQQAPSTPPTASPQPQTHPTSDGSLPPTTAMVVVTQTTVSVELSSPDPPIPDPQHLEDPQNPQDPRPQTWTVSGLVRHVRGLVERGYGEVTVEGEISNWRPAGSGHCYFTVKDAGAQLPAVLFRRQATLLRFQPCDGDAVRLHGQLSVYESRGQMQLIVEWMEQVGLGALLAAVQRLKERLRREGLFDRQRPLPPFPRCIGVITSPQGAALRDIIKVCRRRHAAVHLLIYPAAVQGPNCPSEIAAGLRWFNAHPDRAEVVLVARGGGSWEDLHGFDDERVARAIAASTLPVITGIGHATDSTIADAAADLCAPTPSAAAEILTAAQHRVDDHLARLHLRLLRAASHELVRAHGRYARLSAAIVLRRVEDSLNLRAQRLDELTFRAESALRDRLRRSESRLRLLGSRLDRQNPAVRLAEARRRLQALRAALETLTHQHTAHRTSRLDRSRTRLEALSPLRVLDRGYALVYGPDNHLLRDAATVHEGQTITARLAHGSLVATVKDRR